MLEKMYMAKVRDDAIIPSKRDEDAGYDIYANFKESYLMISPGEIVEVPTGIASAIEPGYYIQFQEKGGTGTRGMSYRAGVIDSGYRGEWFFPINNTTRKTIIIYKGDKRPTVYTGVRDEDLLYTFYPYKKAIGQGVVKKYESPEVVEITLEELQTMPSERGTGKLGSTGK